MEAASFDSIIQGHEFLDLVQEGVWVADERGTTVYANPALAAILGYDNPSALVGRPWHEFFPPREPDRFVKVSPDARELRLVPDTLMLGKDGRPLPVSVGLSRHLRGGVTWYVGTVVKASSSAEASGLSEDTGRALMAGSEDGICILREGLVVNANQRFEDLTGYQANQLLGTPLVRLLSGRDREAVAGAIAGPGGLPMPMSQRVSLQTRSGHELECELRLVESRANSHTLLLCFVHDLSQVRRAEQSRTDFVAAVSHELRTPLAAIKESVSLAAESASAHLQERERRYLQIAQEEISRLNRMIANLLEASRMESGKFRLDLEDVRLADVLERSVASLLLFINRKKIAVERLLPESIPSVLGDRDRLLQVFNNLLDNAIKYTPAGGTIRVNARLVEPGAPVLAEPGILPNTPYVQVTVADTGPGIPAEFIERIFGKFERVDPQGPGIGLGLANVRAIVKLHYGRIWARSALGEGTSFSFVLPAKGGP
jgi:PAS domain S-box-containing protein